MKSIKSTRLYGVARANKPDFILTRANAAEVAQICAWLDGLPLAIEMAAAQVKWLPLPRLLAELSERLTELTGGMRDLSPRQQTLRGAIDWSFQLLSAADRALFTYLAIFVGGFSSEAALDIISNPRYPISSALEQLAPVKIAGLFGCDRDGDHGRLLVLFYAEIYPGRLHAGAAGALLA